MQFAFLFPRFKILSGAERLILKLSTGLVDKGHKISLFCHQFDSTCQPLLHPDIQLTVSGKRLDYFKNRYLNAALDYFRSSALARMLNQDFDAVCCFGPALMASTALLKNDKFPVLYFCYEPPRFLYTDREIIQAKIHLPGFLSRPVFNWYRNLDQRLVKNVHAILSNSKFGAQQIEHIYQRQAKVITHGLDSYKPSNKRSELRQRFGYQDQDIVVLTVNYLHPRKRIDLFLDSISKARSIDSRIKGLILGDGPEGARLKKHPNATAAHFAGFIPEIDLHHYYQSADIYLNTARLETFGLSVIEAAGNALPVISVKEGGPLETVIHEKTGLLAEDHAVGISEALLRLAGDLELSKSFGKEGQNYVRKKYSWDQGAQDFLDALNTLKKNFNS